MSMARDYAIDTSIDDFWIKDSIAAGGTNIYYIDLTSGYSPDGEKVFDFFQTGDSSKWSGTYDNIGSDYIQISGSQSMTSVDTFGQNSIIEFEMRRTDTLSGDNSNAWCGLGSSGSYNITTQMYDDAPADKPIRHRAITSGSTLTTNEIKQFTKDTWYYVSLRYTSGESYYDDGTNTDTINSNVPSGSLPILIEGRSGYSQTFQVKNLRVKKYTATAPTITVIDKTTHYEVHVYNSGSTELTDYQIPVPCSSLGISSATESVYVEKLTGNLLEGEQIFIS